MRNDGERWVVLGKQRSLGEDALVEETAGSCCRGVVRSGPPTILLSAARPWRPAERNPVQPELPRWCPAPAVATQLGEDISSVERRVHEKVRCAAPSREK